MRRNRSNWMLTFAAAAAALTMTTPASAQIAESRIRELVKEAAERAAASQQATQPGQPAQPGGTTRPTVRLTLEDAVKFALDRNLDIAVQRLNPEISDIAIASIQSAYHPALTSTVSAASLSQLPTSQLIGGTDVVQATQTLNGGIAQNVPWGG